MEIKAFRPRELMVVLRALRHVAVANDRFTDGERILIEGVARLHDVDLHVDDLAPIAFEEVAGVVLDPHRRKRAVQLAIVMAMVEGIPTIATEKVVRELATQLRIDEEGLDVLYEMAHGDALMARFDVFRRFTRLVRHMPGFPGPLRFFLPVLGLAPGDKAKAAPYHALASCAPGTLGRAFHDHFTSNGFRFPGERFGLPMVFHDLGHVLAGYGTDPEGEIQQAAFQAGFLRQDGFTFMLFGILQFHLGLRVTPVARGYQGLFDVGRVLTALERGAACKVDISTDFDVLAHRDRPLEEVRAELGIPPLPALERAA